LAKLCVLSYELEFDHKKVGLARPVFELSAVKAKIKGVLAVHTVAMVIFSPHFDVLYDQLLNRGTAT